MCYLKKEKSGKVEICRPTYIKRSGLVPYCTNLNTVRG